MTCTCVPGHHCRYLCFNSNTTQMFQLRNECMLLNCTPLTNIPLHLEEEGLKERVNPRSAFAVHLLLSRPSFPRRSLNAHAHKNDIMLVFVLHFHLQPRVQPESLLFLSVLLHNDDKETKKIYFLMSFLTTISQ